MPGASRALRAFGLEGPPSPLACAAHGEHALAADPAAAGEVVH